ncbi:MAG: hypothetical protein JSS66_13755 [Armatimonadetes bacterium]|nr:hypothetical protein [Armatimonadota bacterium]
MTLQRCFLLAALAVPTICSATELKVEIGSNRSPQSWEQRTDHAVRAFTLQTAKLSSGYRASLRRAGRMTAPYTLPLRVVLTSNGAKAAFKGRGGGDIVPTFDTTGSNVFPDDYKTFLQQVFSSAKPAMNAIFGTPAVGGPVAIKNYDATIQDRYAVAGGYYVPNGTSGPEVRFPVYNNRVAAAVNYIHTLLLAYMADKQYPWDAYNEGLVRAATMMVSRIPGAIPGSPDPDQIESTLQNLYDVGTFYDWYNKVGLGGPQFIAPNLLDTDLPIGGSTGGIFLLRYQMAGTAWAKVAVRSNGFIAEYNSRFYANPSLYQTTGALEALGQTVLDFLSGTSNTTIEGMTFSQWALRQTILDTRLTAGLKLVATPIPVIAQPGSSDFGVFDIVLNAFESKSNGDELLLSGTAFPIYWRPDFTRFFTSAQDDQIKIAGAYGSVTPNFPSDTFTGKPYRVVVDLPLAGKNARVFLPAGAVSTGANPDPLSFYGTVAGLAPVNNLTVSVTWNGGAKNAIPVSNNAFSSDIQDATFLRPGTVTIKVFDGSTQVLVRSVVKSQGALAVELIPSSSTIAYSFTRPNRLALMGLPVEPFRPNPADILGLSDGATLFGRWNSNVARYVLYPDEGEFRQGNGYWVRPPSSASRTVVGRSIPGVPVAVSLSPGWNQVTVPFTTGMTTANVLVTVTSEAVGTYDQATADGTLGPTMFEYSPDPTDPDAGTMVPTTTFAPGKAVFVRANRPEGAVLLFVPSGGTRGNRPNGDRPQYHLVWEDKVTLIDARGRSSTVSIGQAGGASNSVDRALDSELPPLFGGMQLGVLGQRWLFRDIRGGPDRQVYTLKMTGLKSGRRYALRFAPSYRSPYLFVQDGSNRFVVTSNTEYVFSATSPNRTISVAIGGSW